MVKLRLCWPRQTGLGTLQTLWYFILIFSFLFFLKTLFWIWFSLTQPLSRKLVLKIFNVKVILFDSILIIFYRVIQRKRNRMSNDYYSMQYATSRRFEERFKHPWLQIFVKQSRVQTTLFRTELKVRAFARLYIYSNRVYLSLLFYIK